MYSSNTSRMQICFLIYLSSKFTNEFIEEKLKRDLAHLERRMLW